LPGPGRNPHTGRSRAGVALDTGVTPMLPAVGSAAITPSARRWLRIALCTLPVCGIFELFLRLVAVHGYKLKSWSLACENGRGPLAAALTPALRADCWVRVGYNLQATFLSLAVIAVIVAVCLWLGSGQVARIPLPRLATLVLLALVAQVAAMVGSIVAPRLVVAGEAAFIAALVAFAAWLCCAHSYASQTTWPQRYQAGWAFGAWLVPVGSLYLPFRVTADIWNAGLVVAGQPARSRLPRWWWASWLALLCVGISTGGLPISGLPTGRHVSPAIVAAFIVWAGLTATIVQLTTQRFVRIGPACA